MGLIKSANTPATLATFSMKDIELQARAILVRAQSRAEELLAEAQQEGEKLKEAAYAQGHAAGREDGFARGREEGRRSGHDQALGEHREKLSALAASLVAGVKDLDNSRQRLEVEGLKEVIELAIAIARRVTKRQGLLDPDVLRANLAEAMKMAVHAADVRIALHPSQKQTLLDELPKLALTWPSLGHAELIEDASLSPGSCRIFTAHGQVDADLDGQLDRVVDQLLPEDSGGAA